ncbi:MAG: Stp1/IreP family PP2C-type Ser/Thr phosphatase [Streptosporangiales bacterium]|nr:Stp1/IreP family PP2C-type Ser/Thr phosphatase [Streptosporangiales bacterium]
MTLSLRYTAASDVGLLRKVNQDSAYAGPNLVAVADGMGGHAHGEVASATAIAALARLDEEVPSSDLEGALRATITEANASVRGMVEADSSLEGMGTTVTALLFSNNRFCLGHIGDSRAYLLRDGQLHQVTKDHTLVQSMVDEGKLTEEQAAVHPQRSLLLRALGTSGSVEPDLNMHEARFGDRWLLCSDGLTGVVTEETIGQELTRQDPLEAIAGHLIDLANRGGGPDNITCVIADVVESTTGLDYPVIAGAASEAPQASSASDSAASRAAALTTPPQVEAVEYEEPLPPPRRRPWLWIAVPVIALVLVVGLVFAAWQVSMSQYYIGEDDGNVAIYRGLSQPIGPLQLNQLVERTDIRLSDLPAYEKRRVKATIDVDDRAEAYAAAQRLGEEAAECADRKRDESKPGSSAKPTTGACSP